MKAHQSPRFNQWVDVGQVTVTPNDEEIVVGDFSLDVGDNALWVKMTCLNTGPWPWSYAILSWRSSQGYELGSVKAYSEVQGEVFLLGNGLQPVERTGVITIRPRSFNLGWVQQGNPWTLSFQAQAGVAGGGGNNPTVNGGTVSSFASAATGKSLPLVRVTFRNDSS